MIIPRAAAVALLTALAGAAGAAEQPYPWQPAPSYSLSAVSQFNPAGVPDFLPKDRAARAVYARALALEATIYGLPAVYQYREMFLQSADPGSPRYVGFNRFAHDRDLAGPGYKAFKTPNSDTLYSNAWLDLTRGPVLIESPDVPLKYYTLNFFDMFSNASNISTRTFGRPLSHRACQLAGRGPGWRDPVPSRHAARMGPDADLCAEAIGGQIARGVQDAVTITPLAATAPSAVEYPPPDVDTAGGFFRVLDHVLRTDGHPEQEDALVYRFRSIGIGGQEPFDIARLDPETRAAIEAGFAEAMKVIVASRSQLGVPTGTGWTKVEKSNYTFNYLARAVKNYVGLGANVSEENLSFNTFLDAGGQLMDGSKGNYTLELKPPPPVNAFWSVTLYDDTTRELYPNALNRYLINDRTPSLKVKPDGSITLLIQHDRPKQTANWLPAPDRPFYLVIRSYLPKPEMISGGWRPEPVRLVSQKGSGS